MRSLRRPPIAFAHRGASALAPENTIRAFSVALELRATGLETDAWLAADGEVVLVHDRSVRHDGATIDVTRATSRDLRPLGIPTLRELYATLGSDFELSVDIEHPAVAVPLVRVALAAGDPSKLWVCHDDIDLLVRAKQAVPAIRLVCSTRRRRARGGLRLLIPGLADRGIDVLNMKAPDWTAAAVERTHAAGLLAFSWDAQDETSMERLVALGVDGIYSDHPDRLAQVVGRVG